MVLKKLQMNHQGAVVFLISLSFPVIFLLFRRNTDGRGVAGALAQPDLGVADGMCLGIHHYMIMHSQTYCT